MIIKEIKDKNIWENFLLGCEDKTFLNSWNWGEFQTKMRGKIWRFGFFENNKMIAVALVVKIAAKRGTFLLVPHGPVLTLSFYNKLSVKQELFKILLDKLRKISLEEKASFIRINPILEKNEENNKIFSSLNFKLAPIQMHPEASWKLDITLPEEQLLANMRRTTRYLIKQALSNSEIQVERSVSLKDIEIFSEMHKKVSSRQRFVPFSISYLKSEFSAFQEDSQMVLFFGKYKGEIAAASFVIFWSKIGFYHHAASLPQYSKLSIPYLLQWEAIKEAKKRGCKLYDFWGYVDPKEEPRHPWAGPTLFKMGFGGKAFEYVKTQDLPLNLWYWKNWAVEKMRRWKRGL